MLTCAAAVFCLLSVAAAESPASITPVVVIELKEPVAVPEGVALEARMISAAGLKVFEPAAFVRPVGTSEFARLPMEPLPESRFRAVVPSALAAVGCEYFVEAFDLDGNGPFRKGTPERPLHLLVRPEPDRAAKTDRAANPSKDSRYSPRTAGVVLAASGGAALIAGGVLTGLAIRDSAASPSARSSARSESLTAGVLLGVGVAAAVGGLVLWISDSGSSRSSPARPMSLSAAPIPGGACAALSGHF